MSAEARPCVLIVGEAAEVAAALQGALGRAGFEAHAVESEKAALEWAGRRMPDVVVLRLGQAQPGGFSVLRQLRTRGALQPVPAVVLTAHQASSAALDPALLVAQVRRALGLPGRGD